MKDQQLKDKHKSISNKIYAFVQHTCMYRFDNKYSAFKNGCNDKFKWKKLSQKCLCIVI